MSRREKQRQNTILEIKSIARQQMAENGTAAVSLNAIARQMEMSTPALYRYFACRDELITDLILDAYNDLADYLTGVDAKNQDSLPNIRLLEILLAYRDWAMEHAVDFQLIYGNPIPGYHAPYAVTAPSAQRTFAVILNVLLELHNLGILDAGPEFQSIPEELNIFIPSELEGSSPGYPKEVLYIGLVGWYRIHGMIMLEMFHHNTALMSDPALFYKYQVQNLLQSYGMIPA